MPRDPVRRRYARAPLQTTPSTLAIIAGNGTYPFATVRGARAGGVARIVAVAFEGETEPEIFQAMDDLREVGCQVLTMGQYLRPSPKHLPVVEYITPEQFDLYGEIARKKGFEHVASGPLVRSSYHAADFHPVVR